MGELVIGRLLVSGGDTDPEIVGDYKGIANRWK